MTRTHTLQITYHNLQVIFQRLHLKQGAPPQGGMLMPTAAQASVFLGSEEKVVRIEAV